MHTFRALACLGRATSLLGLLLLAGCGGYSESDKVPVRGRVSWEGTPVEFGAIAFVPTPNTRGLEAVSTTIQGGEYSFDAERGPVPGEYRVQITWHKKTGKTIPLKNDPPNVMDETVQVIPERFNTRTELVRNVEAKVNSFDFDLRAGDNKASP
jgi:hypothetical protein